MLKQFDRRRQTQLAWLLLILIMVVYSVEMSHQAILRYDTFRATAFDLGNMDQVLWNTIHGRFFQFTNQAIDWYGPPTRLAIHFEPILLPLSLLYVFHADPRILLVFQTLVLAIGALPVFLLARKYLPAWPLLAAVMAAAYLMMPALLGINLFDFHPDSLATPLLLFALLAMTYRRYGWLLLCSFLACACKEDIPLVVAMFGVMLIWKYQLRRLGLTLLAGGILWSFIALRFIIPHFYTGVLANNFWYRYETLGSTPQEAIVNITLHPWILLTTFVTLDRLYYLASILRSTGFLSLLAPEWLIPALPLIALNVFSTDSLVYSGVYHYNAAIIPFVVFSAIIGTRRLISLWYTWRDEQDEHEESEPAIVEHVKPERSKRTWQLIPNMPKSGNSMKQYRMKMSAALWIFVQHLSKLSRQAVQRIRRLPISLRLAKMWVRLCTFLSKSGSNQWEGLSARMIPLAKRVPVVRFQWLLCIWIIFLFGLNFLLASPNLNIFWADHEPGNREQRIEQLLAMIPPDASVSASPNLNPHLSERQRLAIFPSIQDSVHGDAVQYIIVDLNSFFPEGRAKTVAEFNQLWNGPYRIVKRVDGVVLLVHRPPLP